MKKYLAKEYNGGDGPILLVFSSREELDAYIKCHDYCNFEYAVEEEKLYDEAGNTYGTWVKQVGEAFIDVCTGAEL